MGALKFFGWIFGGVVVLLAATVAALWFGGDRVAVWALEHPVSTAIGRQISIDGPLHIEWGAPSRITIENVRLANASWSDHPDMFAAKHLEIDIFLRSLIWGPLRIPAIAVEGGALRLETSDKGDASWNMGAKAAVPQKRTQFPDLEKLTLKDTTLVFRNGDTKAETDVAFTTAEIDDPGPTEAVSFKTAGTFQKHPMHLDGTVGAFNDLRDASKPYPLKLKGGLDQVGLIVDGTIKEPLDFNGLDLRLSINGVKLDEVTSLLGVPLPKLPDFRGTAVVNGGNGSWKINSLTIALGKSDLEGGLEVDTNAKVPHIEANLTSRMLDLADFSGFVGVKPATASGPAPPPDPSGRVLPDAKIPVEKLPDLNADLSYDATMVKAPSGLPIERVSMGMQLKDGALSLKPLRFHTAKGDVDLNLAFTPFTKSGPPHLTGDVDVRHIDLHELLSGPNMSDMVKQTGGTVGGFIKIDTTGTSIREFLGRANGDAGIFLGNGQLSELLEQLAPIDVLGALGVYLRGDKPIQINCLVTRFDVQNGVANASTFLVDTNDTQIVGSGNVNFANETLDLHLKPANKSFTALSLRAPVDIGGTLGKPDFHLETGNLIARVGASIGLGIVFPPAVLLPLVDTGLGEGNACSAAYAKQAPPGQHLPQPPQQAQRPAKPSPHGK